MPKGKKPAPTREIVREVRTREGKATLTITGSDAEMDRLEAHACVGCKRADKPLRHCADDKHRCVACRRDWLDRVHSTPVRNVPASVGEQSSFV